MKKAANSEEIHERYAFFKKISLSLGSSPVPEELFRAIVAEIRKAVPCDRCVIAHVNPETTEHFFWHVESDADILGLTPDDTLELGNWIFEEIYRKKKLVYIPDLSRSGVSWLEKMGKSGLRKSVFVPIIQGEECIANLGIHSNDPGDYSEYQIALLEDVAALVGPAIQSASLYRQAHDRNRRLEISGEIAKAVGSTLEPDSLFKTIVREIRRAIPCVRCLISVSDQEGMTYNMLYLESDVDLPSLGVDSQNRDRLDVLYNKKQPFYVKDYAEIDSTSARRLAEAGCRSSIFIPIIQSDQCIAHFALGREEPDAFTEEDMELLSSISDHIGSAIRNATLYRDVDDRAKRLEIAGNIARAVSSELDPDELFKTIVSEIRQVVPYVRCLISELDPKEISYKSLYLESDVDLPSLGMETPNRARLDALYNKKQPFYVKDYAESDSPNARRLVEAGLRSSISIPIIQSGQCIAHFSLSREEPNAFTDEDGELLTSISDHIGSAIRNATLYREAREHGERLAEAQKVAHIGSWERNLLTDKMYWSDETYRIFGMQPQEIAITFEEFISRVHPEDRDTIRERNINLLQEKETFRFDYRIPLPDGNTRIVHTESRLYRDKAGNPLRIVGTVQDVTEKTRAERERERYIERLTVLNGLTQKVSTSLDLDEVLQSILESTEVFLNVSNIAVYTHNGDAFRLKACRGSYFEERPHRTYSLGEGFVGAAAEGGSLIFIDDVAGHPGWKDKKAALKWGIRTSLCIPLKSEGRVIGVLSCLTSQPREYTDEEYLLIESLANMAAIAIRNAENHSNLRKTLEELRRSQEMIVRAEKLSSLGTLAAGAAHEILNPASVIRMRAELIAEDNPEEGLEYQSANIIVRNIDRIRNICDDLRKFSRDEVSNFELFDLRGVLRFSYELLKHEFSPKGIASSLNLDNSPLEVMGNSGHLQQVFVNLIKNALDASSGEGEISVSTSSAELDGTPFWEIRVSDSGTGIPKETLPRIFDPFFTTKDPDKGTGLGLSIIHGIVKDHGGEIFVESKEGKGTTFIVRLPRAYKKSTD